MDGFDKDMQELAVDISRLEDPAFREEVKEAEVVMGWEVSQKKEIVFYGREAIKKAVTPGQSAWVTRVLIAFDIRTDQLRYLCDAVQDLKGRHEYEPSGFRAQAPKTRGPCGIRKAMALVPWLAQLLAEGQRRELRRRPPKPM